MKAIGILSLFFLFIHWAFGETQTLEARVADLENIVRKQQEDNCALKQHIALKDREFAVEKAKFESRIMALEEMLLNKGYAESNQTSSTTISAKLDNNKKQDMTYVLKTNQGPKHGTQVLNTASDIDVNQQTLECNVTDTQYTTRNHASEKSRLKLFDMSSKLRFLNPGVPAPPGMASSQRGQISKRAADPEVAFHVYLSGERCYSNHELFVFDRVEVNIGSGYNSHDGLFDAPATGLYVFSWTVVAKQEASNWFSAELIIDGTVKGTVVADSDTAEDIILPATGLVLAHVNAGDHVYIRYVKGGDGCHVVSNSRVRTTFSGWLM